MTDNIIENLKQRLQYDTRSWQMEAQDIIESIHPAPSSELSG